MLIRRNCFFPSNLGWSVISINFKGGERNHLNFFLMEVVILNYNLGSGFQLAQLVKSLIIE